MMKKMNTIKLAPQCETDVCLQSFWRLFYWQKYLHEHQYNSNHYLPCCLTNHLSLFAIALIISVVVVVVVVANSSD